MSLFWINTIMQGTEDSSRSSSNVSERSASRVFPLVFKLELLAVVFVHQGFPSLFTWVVGVFTAMADQYAEERLVRSQKLKQNALVLFGSALSLSVLYYLAALGILTEEGGALRLKYAGLFLGML